MHHFNTHNLTRAFHALDGSKASGIDRVTKYEYQQYLTENIEALHVAIRRGGFYPRPAREVLIPKPQGGTRPLAVGCLEDKIVPDAHGSHPRSHLRSALRSPQLRLPSREVAPTRLSAGCTTASTDDGRNASSSKWTSRSSSTRWTTNGSCNASKSTSTIARSCASCAACCETRSWQRTARSGTTNADHRKAHRVSPILANVYLHFLLDRWFRENFSGRGEMVRYADDAVFVFSDETTARNFQARAFRAPEDRHAHPQPRQVERRPIPLLVAERKYQLPRLRLLLGQACREETAAAEGENLGEASPPRHSGIQGVDQADAKPRQARCALGACCGTAPRTLQLLRRHLQRRQVVAVPLRMHPRALQVG